MGFWSLRKAAFLLLILNFSFFAGAQELEVVVEPVVSYNLSYTSDYLYETSGTLNSRLDWNALYLFNAGCGLSLKKQSFIFKTSLLFNLPLECGLMYDSDWRTPGLKTNLSKSDLYSGFGGALEFYFSWEVPLAAGFNFYPIIAINDTYKTLRGKNTIGWCGDVNHTGLDHNLSWDDPAAKTVRKYDIDLYNNVAALYFGAGLGRTFGPVNLELAAMFTPITYVYSVDHHHGKTGGSWYNMIQKALSYDLRFAAAYNFSKNYALNLSAAWAYCPVTKGLIYPYGYKYPYEEPSGISFSNLRAALSLKIKIR